MVAPAEPSLRGALAAGASCYLLIAATVKGSLEGKKNEHTVPKDLHAHGAVYVAEQRGHTARSLLRFSRGSRAGAGGSGAEQGHMKGGNATLSWAHLLRA